MAFRARRSRTTNCPRIVPKSWFFIPGFLQTLFGKVRFEFVSRLLQISTGHDVVALEYGACLVAADRHRDALGHTGTYQVSDSGSTEIVEQMPLKTSPRAGGLPSFIEAAHALAVTHENEF